MPPAFPRPNALRSGYNHSLGGMSYCTTRIRAILDDMGDSEGVSRADEASDKIDWAQEKKLDWNKQKNRDHLKRSGSRELDNKIDDTLGNLSQTVDGVAGIDSDSENTRLAREIRDDLFPNGVAHITTQPFDDQHLAVDKVLGRLRNEYDEHVEKLSLEPLVGHLDELNEEFGEELAPDEDAIQYDEVEAARKEAEDAFDLLIFYVAAEYGDDIETMNEILDPLAEQRERARRHYQRRGTVPPIDPESGEPVDPNDDPTRPDSTGQTDGGQPTGDSEPTGGNESTGDDESSDDDQSTGDNQSSGDGDGQPTDG